MSEINVLRSPLSSLDDAESCWFAVIWKQIWKQERQGVRRVAESPDSLATRISPAAGEIRSAFKDAADAFWMEQIATDTRLAHDLLGTVRGPVRANLGELAADIGRSAYLILDAHAEFVLGLPQKLADFGQPRPMPEDLQMQVIRDRQWSAYVLAFKSFFLFLRAYQDVAWVLIREVVDGVKLRVGIGAGRMSQAFSCDTPARTHLLENVPNYTSWFDDWRSLRNQVKTGANFGIREVQTDPGVTFTTMRDLPDRGGLAMGGEGDRIVRIRELTHALAMMRSVAQAVRTARLRGAG